MTSMMRAQSKFSFPQVAFTDAISVFSERPSWLAFGQGIPYSACDQIASFYEKQNVVPKETSEFMKERSYKFAFQQNSEKVSVTCTSYFYWLGLHALQIKQEDKDPVKKVFVDVKNINYFNGKTTLQMPFHKEDTIVLPRPY